jgi:hypothetical protein
MWNRLQTALDTSGITTKFSKKNLVKIGIALLILNEIRGIITVVIVGPVLYHEVNHYVQQLISTAIHRP